MTESSEAARRLYQEVFAPSASSVFSDLPSLGFASELSDLSMRNVFEALWLRPGLDRRARSLVTIGILIGRGQTQELKVHAAAAIRNGCTVEELEEVVYQASGYAGFPAAVSAMITIGESLRANGMLGPKPD